MRSNIPRLTPVSWSRFIQRLRELGFDGPYADGRHPYMQRGDITLIIPNSHQGDIGIGLRRLLQQADISRDEWLGE